MKVEEQELSINYDKLLVDFIEEKVGHLTRVRPDGFGITVLEFCELKGVSVEVARKALNGLVKQGLLKSELMILPGKIGRNPLVYYRNGEDE